MFKKRIILKLSGAALKDKTNDNVLSIDKLLDLSNQIKTLSKTHQICIVVGGGNIWRGGTANLNIYREEKAHYMGMIATIINSMALQECLIKNELDVETVSALPITSVLKTYTATYANKALDKNKIVILAGGTGKPFFSTDTGAAKDAIELKASMILMAKDGVDGVYSDDPKKCSSAQRFSQLTFKEAIERNLKVMDLDALKLCLKHHIDILVFNIERKDAIINAIQNKIPTTIITN
jgi:uridylate kinase